MEIERLGVRVIPVDFGRASMRLLSADRLAGQGLFIVSKEARHPKAQSYVFTAADLVFALTEQLAVSRKSRRWRDAWQVWQGTAKPFEHTWWRRG